MRQAKEMEKDAKVRIEIQRQEYEAAIQRHLSFIDQLIDDKKVLSDRCEELVKKLKEIDKKYSDKIKQMDERYGRADCQVPTTAIPAKTFDTLELLEGYRDPPTPPRPPSPLSSSPPLAPSPFFPSRL